MATTFWIQDPEKRAPIPVIIDDDESQERIQEVLAYLEESRKEWLRKDKMEHRHTPYSIDALEYEGLEYADPSIPIEELIRAEANEYVQLALDALTETQRRRLLLKCVDGKSLSEIAEIEGVDRSSVAESIEAAKRKFRIEFEELYP